MPFSVSLRNPCLPPADSSILSTVPSRPSSSIKTIFRRYFFKNRSSIIQDHQPQFSIRKIQRTKGSSSMPKAKSNGKSHSKSKTTNSYDMTILHDDELQNTQLAIIRRRKKKIPFWANHDQLQLAIINQVYFQDQNPEDIFGRICIEHAFDMINSLAIKHKGSTSLIVSRHYM